MATCLAIPPCTQLARGRNHPPPVGRPLRIQIAGPNSALNKVFDDRARLPETQAQFLEAFDEAGVRLARMAFRLLYSRDVNDTDPADFVPRSQYSTLRQKQVGECEHMMRRRIVDTYGITFDHLVPPDDEDPEVLMINTFDTDGFDLEAFFHVNLAPFNVEEDPVVFLVPACCQVRDGSNDRERINKEIKDYEAYQRGDPSS